MLSLADLIKPYVPARNLRSANQNLLHQPKFNLKTFRARAFSVSAPALWNSMPVELKQKDSTNSFKKYLKKRGLLLKTSLSFDLFNTVVLKL
jgi:hypothetical protein